MRRRPVCAANRRSGPAACGNFTRAGPSNSGQGVFRGKTWAAYSRGEVEGSDHTPRPWVLPPAVARGEPLSRSRAAGSPRGNVSRDDAGSTTRTEPRSEAPDFNPYTGDRGLNQRGPQRAFLLTHAFSAQGQPAPGASTPAGAAPRATPGANRGEPMVATAGMGKVPRPGGRGSGSGVRPR
jgi:hypothetical protein